jgi:hypothetical protein
MCKPYLPLPPNGLWEPLGQEKFCKVSVLEDEFFL